MSAPSLPVPALPAPSLSPAAKSKMAAAVAVVMAGITAWQIATRDGFTWLDIVPVAAAVAGSAATALIPNTPHQPKATAIAHWALSAVAAVACAVSGFTATDPAGATATKLLVVAAGAFLVWYVPELRPALARVEATGEVRGADVAAVAAVLAEGEHAAGMRPDLPVTPRQIDGVPSAAYAVRDIPVPPPAPGTSPTA